MLHHLSNINDTTPALHTPVTSSINECTERPRSIDCTFCLAGHVHCGCHMEHRQSATKATSGYFPAVSGASVAVGRVRVRHRAVPAIQWISVYPV